MQWFNPARYGWAILLGILFLGTTHSLFAEDIEIDLGTTPTPAAQAKPTSVQAKNQGSSSSISEINVSAIDSGTLVSISGQKIPKPTVDKIVDKKGVLTKLVAKFPKTGLSVAAQLIVKDRMVKGVRSSDHEGTAWVVLDVSGVKTWAVDKAESGYAISLKSAAGSTAKTVKTKTSTSEPKNNKEGAAPSDGKSVFARLIGASFKPVDKGVKLVLTLNEPAKYTFRKLSQPEKLVLRFHGTKLDAADKSKKFSAKDIEFLKGGVLSLELRQIGPQFSPISEVILSLVPGTLHEIDRDLNQVVITLVTPVTADKPAEHKGNMNQLVSMDVQNADLAAVVKTLATEAGFDVDFVSGTPLGTISQKFENVPFKTALSNILSPSSYDYEVQGNRIRIGATSVLRATKVSLPTITEIISPAGGMTTAQFDILVRSILKPSNASISAYDSVRNVIVLTGTPADVADYKKAIKDLKLDSGAESDRITKVIKLNYADPAQTLAILTPYLTPAGRVQQDARTNNLVIWETASNIGVLLELVKELDVKSPQVLIESNIVEVDKENDLNLGFNWTVNAPGNPNGQTTYNNTLQNVPVVPPNFSFGMVQSGVNISANLDALETRKMGKIISRPRVATVSGVAAEINSIENVVYSTIQQTTTPGGAVVTTTTYASLPLPVDLKITPRISDDGRITTVITATITSQTGPPAGVGAFPPTSIQTATTTITIKNGETIVIGGLVRDTMSESINGVPLLMNIPLLGELFQQKQLSHRKVELIIFITPTIIQD